MPIIIAYVIPQWPFPTLWDRLYFQPLFSVTSLNRNYFSNFPSGDLARYKWQKHYMGTLH